MICRLLHNLISKSAEREGFKPPVPVTVHLITNQAPSITLTPLQGHKSKNPALAGLLLLSGELGIRTPGTFHSSTVFKTAAIDHSASSPGTKVQIRGGLTSKEMIFFQFLNING